MGGKSKSDSSQNSSQTTTTQTASGIVSGSIYQGQSLTINEEFSDDVKDAFQSIVDLASKSIDLSRDAGTAAVEAIANTKTEITNPGLAQTKQITPVLYILAAGVLAYIIVKGK